MTTQPNAAEPTSTVDVYSMSDLVPGRSCDGCTMCCKLLSIEVLDKPRAVWCTHCDKKRGCKIYADRPNPCQEFYCGYRRIAALDERWKPSQSKVLINYEHAHKRIAIHVDPDRPDAWRDEPFYATLKRWSRKAEADGGSLVIWAGNRMTVVMPHRERDLGVVRDDQYILPVTRQTASGSERDYIVVEADDPRIGG